MEKYDDFVTGFYDLQHGLLDWTVFLFSFFFFFRQLGLLLPGFFSRIKMPKRRFMVLQRATVLPSDFSFSFDLRWHGLPRISRVALFRPRLSTFANAPPSLLQLRSTGVPFLLPQVLSDFLRVYLRATMSTSSLTSNRIISLLFLLGHWEAFL